MALELVTMVAARSNFIVTCLKLALTHQLVSYSRRKRLNRDGLTLIKHLFRKMRPKDDRSKHDYFRVAVDAPQIVGQ